MVRIVNGNFREAAETRLGASSNTGNPRQAAGIRRQCGIVFDFFDDLFGEGTHRQIFGEKVNLGICLDAFKEFTDLVNAQKDAMAAKVQQYTPNRETRRAIQKAARRSQPTARPAPAAGGES